MIKAAALTGSMIALMIAHSMAANAGPWAEPGDRRLRSDLELLADHGILKGPVTSWPVPWRQISDALYEASESDDLALSPALLAAIVRIEKLMPNTAGGNPVRFDAGIAVTNETALIRDFGDSARGELDSYFRADYTGDNTALSLGGGYRDDPLNGNLNFDRSYLAQALGNWVMYGGYVDQWWGPGWDSALIFSTNARPMPKIGIKRLSPHAFTSRWLSWIGPWQAEAFVGLVDESREFSNHIVAGIRVTMVPVDRLEIGFTRALQLCGSGRPCGAGTWFDALIGYGNADNTGTLDEPGNQLAGIDIRFSRRLGAVSAALYGQISGEDEDNTLIDQIAVLGGVNLAGALGDDGGAWRLVAEYADTLANRSFPGRIRPGSTYRNFIYTDGFTYRERAIGHTLDSDSWLLSVSGSYTAANNYAYRMAFRHADINAQSRPDHRVSLNNEVINLFEAEIDAPTLWGDLRAEFRLADDSPNTPGRSKGDVAIELGWRVRF